MDVINDIHKVRVYWDYVDHSGGIIYDADHIQYVWNGNVWKLIKRKKIIEEFMFGVGYGLIKIPYTVEFEKPLLIKSFLTTNVKKLNRSGLLRVTGFPGRFGVTFTPMKIKELKEYNTNTFKWLEDFDFKKIAKNWSQAWNNC